MKWKKLGQIFCAGGQNENMMTGGRTPVPVHIEGSLYRIFFASYDVTGRGKIFSLDLDIGDKPVVQNLVTEPVVDIGEVGFFDDNGIIPSDAFVIEDKIYLYTIGFSVKNKIIFDAATGLAISDGLNKPFKKFTGPIIDRGVDDPCFAASPSVMREADGWRMWYVSCDRWEPQGEGYKHFYNIKHKRSKDGVYWEPGASICIDYENEHEYAISRPSVIRDNSGKYQMWYSFRAQPDVETYRIGYAESDDGLNWNRMDRLVGLDVSEEGWDSEMICYPKVFKHDKHLYMLYNGNGYGRSGFGLAVLEEE